MFLLNCTQVENQIYNEGEMLFLSIIEVVCKDMSSEKRARNERKMQMSPNNIGLCTGYIPWK